MRNMRKKPELLLPAAGPEVLRTAVRFGADAVYIGGEAFGLRAKAKNFTLEEMADGIRFAHARGKKVYVTANILAHNRDLEEAEGYFETLRDLRDADGVSASPDALIVSDPGLFSLAKRIWPDAEFHTCFGMGWVRSGWSAPGNFRCQRSGRSGKRYRKRWRSKVLSTVPCVFPIPADAC